MELFAPLVMRVVVVSAITHQRKNVAEERYVRRDKIVAAGNATIRLRPHAVAE